MQRTQRHHPIAIALGLLGVAVVAGFLWWLIRHDATPQSSAHRHHSSSSSSSKRGAEAKKKPKLTPVQAGPAGYQLVDKLSESSTCDKASSGQLKQWFQQNPCQQLNRGVFVTGKGKSQIAVSVAVVTMPSPAQAGTLKSMVDNGAGNVGDLHAAGKVDMDGMPKLSGGSRRTNALYTRVAITQAAPMDGSTVDKPAVDQAAQQSIALAPYVIGENG